MFIGFLGAAVMLITFLLDETLFSVLPLPWRLIPAALVVALALMHRVSFELGAAFFLVSVLAAVLSGLAPLATLLVAVISVAAAYGLIVRVFARRSLVAFGGVALLTSFVYLLLRYSLVSHVGGFFPWIYIFSAFMTATSAVVVSIILQALLSGFGRRFVTKNETYEVRGER